MGNFVLKSIVCHKARPPKVLLIMKFIFFIMTLMMINTYATTHGQNITLSEKNTTFENIIKKLRQQSGYDFLLDKEILRESKKIDITLNNVSLNHALQKLTSDRQLDFSIEGKSVVIVRRPIEKKIVKEEKTSILQQGLAGVVVDERGAPLVGATVKVKERNQTTSTDDKGFFRFDRLEVGDILEISYVGYQISETTVTPGQLSQQEYMIINMKPLIGHLEEIKIVNTGFQKLNRENITGSVTTVGSAEIEKRNSVSIMENLEGKIPGLVQYQGKARIRGVSTINANEDILIVVDGLPIEGSIADINPYDVETVNVLKDAAAAAMYGARASNGVIVVTTKRADKTRQTTVDALANVTVTEKPDYSYKNFLTPSQQVDWESDFYKWWFSGGEGTVPQPIQDFESNITNGDPISPVQYSYYQLTKNEISQEQLEGQLDSYRNNDFAKEYRDHALLKGILQQYNLALRTNSGKAQNNLIVNYTADNQGIINAYDKRINLNYKGMYSVDKWVDIDYGVNSVISKKRGHNNSFAVTPFNVPSYYRLLNDDGSRNYYHTNRFNAYNTITEAVPELFSATFNHLDELERDYVNTSTLNTRYYINLNIKPFKGLTISPMLQYEDIRTDISAYSEAESYTMRWLHNVYTYRQDNDGVISYPSHIPKGGKLSTSNLRRPNYTARAQANYNNIFGKHRIIALGGMELRQTRVYGEYGILLGYDDQSQTQLTNFVNFDAIYNLQQGTLWNNNYPTRQYHIDEVSPIGLERDIMHRFASGYANATYTYDDKYNFFGSFRKDYADLFGGDEKYRGKPLWSVGASWVASNEDFLKPYNWINYLKIRTSYGLTGNIRNVTALLAADVNINNLTQLPNATVANPPNPQLRWEKTGTANMGVDFELLDNRLRGTIDWYRRKGTDLFAQKRLDPSEGFTTMIINNASMINNGIELNLSYEWFRASSRDVFGWSSNLTGAWNKNKITDVDELAGNPITLAGGDSYRVGYPVSSLFSFRFAGLDDMGMAQWYNTAGEPTKAVLGPTEANAVVFSGSADPTINFGFNNDFSYKGFNLNVFVVHYGGHYFRARPVPIAYRFSQYASLPSYLLDSWTPTNTDTDIVGSGRHYQLAPSNQYYYSDNLVRRADFIKIRNVVLGYTLPEDITSKIKANNVRVRLQVNNPRSIWIKQNDVHIDPETGGAPIPTSFVFGINANF